MKKQNCVYSIKQQIYDLIEISKVTKIPFLLMTGPGWGKTTNIANYAEACGYHVETLIGSRFNPDDIMGFYVNEPGESVLVQKDPAWFNRIINSKKPTVLFIDEISTCKEDVQGSLLSLIFDRKIGNGKELPEDCVIVSAANYSENLPDYMDIISPTLNRFGIINLLELQTNEELMTEFLTKQYNDVEVRTFQDLASDDFEEKYFEGFVDLITPYFKSSNSLGTIDLKNRDVGGIYSDGGPIYGFISGRTMSYTKEAVKAFINLGITEEKLIRNVVNGFIGLGSNSFKEPSQIETWQNKCYEFVKYIMGSAVAQNASIDDSTKIYDDIDKYSLLLEQKNANGSLAHSFSDALTKKIKNKYEDTVEVFNSIKSSKDFAADFIRDYEAITSNIEILKNETVIGIHQSCMEMYNDLVGTNLTLNDYSSAYGSLKSPFCTKVFVSGGKKYTEYKKEGMSVFMNMKNTESPTRKNLSGLTNTVVQEHLDAFEL